MQNTEYHILQKLKNGLYTFSMMKDSKMILLSLNN